MTFEVWLLFALTETALCLTPGPAVMTVVSLGLSRGARAGIWASVGVLVANAGYFAISATGLFTVLVRGYAVFFWIKWIGAVYLVWLGIQTWRSGAAPVDPMPPVSAVSGAAMRGFAVQFSNPKLLLFFGALLPQFVDPTRPLSVQIAILGVTSIAIEFAVLSGYALLGGRAARFARTARLQKWIHRVGGSLLIAAGAGLGAIRR